MNVERREFLISSGLALAASAVHPAISRALSISANNATRSIADIKHIVVLMQENRSFDHYFGAFRGVRGFKDRFPIPLESGKPVWFQSNGTDEILPFHFDGKRMDAQAIRDLEHNFPDQQAAWNQGKLGYWPKYKTDTSMGYYRREEATFQWALADAFTICDHYFCSVRSATDPNRITFFSGSNIDPVRRANGLNSDQSTAEVTNQRCVFKGGSNRQFRGSALPWKSIPEVLEDAGVSWRIYWDPDDGWNGIMNGAIAFKGIRSAEKGSRIYENALLKWSLDDLRRDVLANELPSVSWILPSPQQSEHPGIPSGPARGGHFVNQVLDALTANPDSWSSTALFVTFDENDGLFDHLPSPAVPSYNGDGSLAGKSTIPVDGMYFEGELFYDDEIMREALDLVKGWTPNEKHSAEKIRQLTDELTKAARVRFIDERDTISGNIRPWGLGARVPTYVVSPWSKGGWVNSQVFDHTSIGRFIERRFGVTLHAISPWHRAVCGDLTSAFDFEYPNDTNRSVLPNMKNYARIEAESRRHPPAVVPRHSEALFQESGTRRSRALPYELHTHAQLDYEHRKVGLQFTNTGTAGAVFHVYDKMNLDRIPRRYTVEAGCTLYDDWSLMDGVVHYDVWVYGPNGFVRAFAGNLSPASARLEVEIKYDAKGRSLLLSILSIGARPSEVSVKDNAYHLNASWHGTVESSQSHRLPLADGHNWYDFTVAANGFERRFAGRMETGAHDISDPAMSP